MLLAPISIWLLDTDDYNAWFIEVSWAIPKHSLHSYSVSRSQIEIGAKIRDPATDHKPSFQARSRSLVRNSEAFITFILCGLTDPIT
jgi:hypothetical protein